jgi:RNA polymerase sigma-70 factor (ECF subfamily)
LHPLTRPIDVVAAVSHEVDLDARDRILRPLAHVAGERAARPVAQALLMLCLWPGLDAIFRRRLGLFRDPGYLAAEIADHFSIALQRLDLRRVACLTATLVRNTERGILDARARDMIMVPTDGVDEVEAPLSTGGGSLFGLPDLACDATVGALRGWLQRTVGEDADLVLQAVILERSRNEVAASLGISCAAARKRLERALQRARIAFLAEAASQTGASDRPC